MQYNGVFTREGDSYLVEFPDCPGCQTFSDSEKGIRECAKEALEGWLESHIVDNNGDKVPRPEFTGGEPIELDDVLSAAIELHWKCQELEEKIESLTTWCSMSGAPGDGTWFLVTGGRLTAVSVIRWSPGIKAWEESGGAVFDVDEVAECLWLPLPKYLSHTVTTTPRKYDSGL